LALLLGIPMVVLLGLMGNWGIGHAAPRARTRDVHASTQPASTQPVQLRAAQVVAIAQSLAAGFGDPSPRAIMYAAGTRYRANLVASGDIVKDSTPVFLVAARGDFVLSNAPRPVGAGAPHGNVLLLVLDAASGKLLDLGVRNTMPDLAVLGPVSVDAAMAQVSRRHDRLGWLTGKIVFAGGPPAPLAARTGAAGFVSVFSLSGRLVARVLVSRGRGYRIGLRPGRYLVNAGRALHPSGGCLPQEIKIRSGRIARRNVFSLCGMT
jgi:hypothetical protein